jgi:hypothetical protein
MVNVNALTAVCSWVLLSVAMTVNDAFCPSVGVPLITPLLDNDNPAGSDPLVTAYVNGAVPATDHSGCEYGLPTVPPGNAGSLPISREAATATPSAPALTGIAVPAVFVATLIGVTAPVLKSVT